VCVCVCVLWVPRATVTDVNNYVYVTGWHIAYSKITQLLMPDD